MKRILSAWIMIAFLITGIPFTALADTNAADAGQVAYFNEIPYVVIKGIANTAGATAVAEYNANVTEANANANEVVYQMLVALIGIPEQETIPRCQRNNCMANQTISWNGCNGCNNGFNTWNRFWWGV